MANRRRALVVLGMGCLGLAACSGTDASGLTAPFAGGVATGGTGGVATGGTGGVATGGTGGIATGGTGGVATGGTGGVATGGTGGVATGGTGGTGGVDAGDAGSGGSDAAPDGPGNSVVYGASASKTACVAGENAFSHVLGWGSGNDRIVLVGALIRGNGAAFNALRYDGIAMRPLVSRWSGNNGWRAVLYYLLDSELPPAAGTYTVNAVTNNAPFNCIIDASSFAHAAQSAPTNVTHQSANAGSFTDGVANPTPGSMAYDFIGTDSGTLTPGGGQTVVTDLTSYSYRGDASYKACGAANPCTMTWDPEAPGAFTYA